MGIFESLLDAGWVKDQVMNNPFEFWTFTVVVATAFFLLGWKLRGWWPSPIERADIDAIVATGEAVQANERAEAVERERAEAERERRQREYAREWALDLSPFGKELVARLRDDGRLVTDWASDYEFDDVFSDTRMAIEATRVDEDSSGRWRWRLSLNGFGSLVAEVASDVLDEVGEYKETQ